MKKKMNKPMRAAGILLLATMLTTCMTAGTFAKYTTSDSATDSARVAKFGVVIKTNGNLFGKDYKDTIVSATDSSITVQAKTPTSGSRENVVAPGTKNDTGLGINISGTPEVDVKFTVTNATTNKNIFLKGSQTYGIMVKANTLTAENFLAKKDSLYELSSDKYSKTTDTTYNVDDSYYILKDVVTATTENYYPVVFKFGGTALGDTSTDTVADTTNGLGKKLETLLNNKTVDSNTNLATAFRDTNKAITWEWAYEKTNDTTIDGMDTILGHLAAQNDNDLDGTDGAVVKLDNTDYVPVADQTDYNLDISVGFTITATQVD